MMRVDETAGSGDCRVNANTTHPSTLARVHSSDPRISPVLTSMSSPHPAYCNHDELFAGKYKPFVAREKQIRE